MNKNRVIIITLNYNQNKYTIDCVKSLLKSDYPNFVIYLIDNGSEINNFNELKVKLPNDERLILDRIDENIGYVGGVNHGLVEAERIKSDYVLIMNNDTIIGPAAISRLVEAAQRYENNAIVSGKVYDYDNIDILQTIGHGRSSRGLLDYSSYVNNKNKKDVGQFDKEMEMGMLDDIFWLVPREVLKKVGYYSDYFFLYGEQNDYALRAMKLGVKLIYTPDAKLWHKGKITTAGGDANSPKIEYWRSFAVMKLAVLHFEKSRAKGIYRSWIIKRIIKNVIYFLLGRVRFQVVLANMFAWKHFLFWEKIRYKDNGYNPFISS